MIQMLHRLIQTLHTAPDLGEALVAVATGMGETLQANVASIFLCDDEDGEYVLVAAAGLPRFVRGRVRLKYGEGLIGYVAEREEPINLAEAPTHPKFHHHPHYVEAEFRGFLGVPIIEQAQLLGVLVLQRSEARYFSEEEEAFCMTLAVQLASAIQSARTKGVVQALTQRRRSRRRRDVILTGVMGAPGIALGTAVLVFPPADLEAVPDREVEDVEQEITRFETALSLAREDIYTIQMRARSTLSVAEHAIFDAYLRILDSRSLVSDVNREIEAGQWAPAALRRVIHRHVVHFESLSDAYLRERAADFRDLGRRILAHLQASTGTQTTYPKNTILVSEEVTATALMEVPEGRLKGVLSGAGSQNSHVAILARALGLPTVMGIPGIGLIDWEDEECIVDGYNGHVYVNPTTTLKREFQALVTQEAQLEANLSELRDLPSETLDGHRVILQVNTGLAADGGWSLRVGAEGVGLYRTELPFMVRDRFPSEEEQRVMYQQLLQTFHPRLVVMRTLDIGGDKVLPYFPIEEDNPFLGWRGIRVTLDHPEIFLQQVRAMLQASINLNNLAILLPMITSVNEVEAALRLINQAYEEVLIEHPALERPLIGLMIEVPAAVYQARELAKRVDFLSVGSNDLIQYLLAVDRNNPRVANLYDGFHPSVLRALRQVVRDAHRAGKRVSICGELAGEPLAVVLLLGMGFDSLSLNARGLPRVKWVIRSFTFEKARLLLDEVIELDDAREVRLHMESALEEAGLGALIGAGRV